MIQNCEIALSSITTEGKNVVFYIKGNDKVTAQSSFSLILSSAAYILHLMPKMPHPTKNHFKFEPIFDNKYPSPYLSLHPLFDEWTQLLTKSFFNQSALRIGKCLYLKTEVSPEFAAILISQLEFLPQVWIKIFPQNKISVQSVFEISRPEGNRHKIGWINCSTSQRNSDQKKSPLVNTVAILLGEIYNNEIYDNWNILQGKIPNVEQLLKYDTLIIPGSGLSVLSQVKEVDEAAENILQAYHKSEKLKIFGICYGHQLIAKKMGAKVVKKPRYGGLELIKFDKNVIKEFPFLKTLEKYNEPNLHFSEHHQDYVVSVPEEYIRLGTSNSCQNEAFISKNGRIFSTQFHAEYNYTWSKAYMARLSAHYGNKIHQNFTSSHSQQTILSHYQSCDDLRKCIKQFI